MARRRVRIKRELQIIAIIVKKDELAVFAPYNVGFISKLKATIHPSQRTWTGDYWKLSPYRDAFEVALRAIKDNYPAAPVIEGNVQALPSFLNADQEENYYTMLGVSEQATPAELKKGYRVAVRRWHPDLDHNEGLGGTESIFHKITRAYEILKDPAARLRYDSALAFIRKGREKR